MGSSTSLHHSDIGQLLGPFDYVGENIAMGSAGVSAGALHVAWMHSQEHRDNILSPGYQEVGIGVYCAPNGSIWATTEFARPTSAGPAAGRLQRRHASESRGPARRRLAHLRIADAAISSNAVAGRRATATAITSATRAGGSSSAKKCRTPGIADRADERARHRREQHARAPA